MDERASEYKRILDAYDARDKRETSRFFSYRDLAHVSTHHERYQATLVLLARSGFHPLTNVKILDVGCGDGTMLRQFLQWGAAGENLAGIELRPEPVNYARRINPDIDIRCGSAASLPWPEASFDLVCQHTVFTSILDADMKRQIASEMTRVLRHRGAVLWYDFRYDNPRNPDVRGVKAREIKRLFPDLEIRLQGITLAPPLAREAIAPFVRPAVRDCTAAHPLSWAVHETRAASRVLKGTIMMVQQDAVLQ